MKKIKEWCKKHKHVFQKVLKFLTAVLLLLTLFIIGFSLGAYSVKSSTAYAATLTYRPEDYHYPLKVNVVVDDDVVLLNKYGNAVYSYYSDDSYYTDGQLAVAAYIENEFNQSYGDLLWPIVVGLQGTKPVAFNSINFESKYFQYVSAPLLSLGLSQSNIQNSYAIYLNDYMRNAISRVYCSYEYNLDSSVTIVTVNEKILEPYSLTTAMSQYPDLYVDNAFTKFPYQPFGSPSYEGVYLVNPFVDWDNNEDLPDTFIAHIYNFSLTIEFNPLFTGYDVDENFHALVYCSYLYDYTAQFPLRTITEVSWFESVADSVDSFLSIEILPDFSFYNLLMLTVVIPLLVAILVSWLGG